MKNLHLIILSLLLLCAAASGRAQLSAPRPVKASEMSGKGECLTFAVKTNMLYDALAMPNIGVEFDLGRGWSLGGGWMYGWWTANSRHRFWRACSGDLFLRKWFGPRSAEKPFTRHHAGVYAQLLSYDFEWGGKGQMAGLPGENILASPSYAFGLEYGYSLPVARRLNIDFSIGVGYLAGKYFEYTPIDGHYVWEATKMRRYFGPTKAEVTLVWLLGNLKEKGGAR